MKGLKWKICLTMKGAKLGEGHMDTFIKLEGKMAMGKLMANQLYNLQTRLHYI